MKTAEVLALTGEGWLAPLASRSTPPVRVRLTHPVRHGDRTLEEVVLGPLRGIHARNAPTSWDTHEAVLLLAGRLSGLPDVVLDQLQGPDLLDVIDATTGLLWPLLELPAARQNAGLGDYPALPDELELELSEPVQKGGLAASRLRFRPMTGKLIRKLPARLELRHLADVVCGLAQLEPALFDELAGRDLQAALGVAQCFFASTRPSGPPSSGSSPSATAGPPTP